MCRSSPSEEEQKVYIVREQSEQKSVKDGRAWLPSNTVSGPLCDCCRLGWGWECSLSQVQHSWSLIEELMLNAKEVGNHWRALSWRQNMINVAIQEDSLCCCELVVVRLKVGKQFLFFFGHTMGLGKASLFPDQELNRPSAVKVQSPKHQARNKFRGWYTHRSRLVTVQSQAPLLTSPGILPNHYQPQLLHLYNGNITVPISQDYQED